LLRLSSEKFLSALRSNPNNFMALYQWAKVLMEQADVTAPQKAEALYKSAIAKLKEVISLKPSFEVHPMGQFLGLVFVSHWLFTLLIFCIVLNVVLPRSHLLVCLLDFRHCEREVRQLHCVPER
jgi:hypothetical protein